MWAVARDDVGEKGMVDQVGKESHLRRVSAWPMMEDGWNATGPDKSPRIPPLTNMASATAESSARMAVCGCASSTSYLALPIELAP